MSERPSPWSRDDDREPPGEPTRVDPFATPSADGRSGADAAAADVSSAWPPPTTEPVGGWGPGSYGQAAGAYGQAAGSYGQAAGSYGQAAGSYGHAPASYGQAPGARTGQAGGSYGPPGSFGAPDAYGQAGTYAPGQTPYGPATYPYGAQAYQAAAWQPYQAPTWVATTDDPWGGRPLVGEEATWVPAAHWLPILTTWLGPLILLLTVGDRNARVREHCKESLNFEITYWLYMVVSVLLMFVLIGFLTSALLPLVWLVLRIVASVDASRGRLYRYPLTIRFLG